MNQDEAKLIALAQKLLEKMNEGQPAKPPCDGGPSAASALFEIMNKGQSPKGKADFTNWRETAEEDSFLTSVENASIWISGGEIPRKYSIRVINRNGSIVASLACGPTDYGYTILKDLHDLARRDALKVDQTINDLLQRLS